MTLRPIIFSALVVSLGGCASAPDHQPRLGVVVGISIAAALVAGAAMDDGGASATGCSLVESNRDRPACAFVGPLP